jgi:hypothetical protein
MTACVVMHNMIVHEEWDDNIYDGDWDFEGELVESQVGATWEYFFAYA